MRQGYLKPRAALLCAWLLLGLSSAAFAAIPGMAEPTLAPMVKRVIPAVANISTRTRIRLEQHPLFSDPFFRRFFGIPEMPQERETQSLGSGVIVDADQGYILTNFHVIKDAQEITVRLHDGREYEARVVGNDPEVDLAVIRIKARGLTAIPVGDSDRLEVGDFVVAIGNAFGLEHTVTSGIVSALGRSGLGIEGYENFIQTDASINPGNSGGALVNMQGELVGINTAIVGPSGGNVGIGFAIPSNMAREVMDQLVRYGEVQRGYLGIYIQDLTSELARALGLDRREGALISRVLRGSPADQAGLEVRDVIIAMNGKPVRNAAQLRNAIGLLKVGSKLELEILRDGRRRNISAVIAKPRK